MFSSFFSGSGGGGGVGAGLLSGFLGGMMGDKAPSAPQLPNQAGAAANLYGDIGGFYNPYSQIQPAEYQQLLAALNNPDLKGYMSGAKRAGQGYDLAGKQAQMGGGLLMNDAYQLYQMGFDPQQALYNKLQQQNTDQSAVMASMYGVGSSPYGAGLADQSNTNFNINWQNQQLQRALDASQGIGRDVTGAQQMYGAGAQDYLMGGQVPYDAYMNALGGVNNAFSTYMQGAQQGNQLQSDPINAWLQYLGMGQGAVGLNQTAFGMDQNTAGMYGQMLYPALYQGFGSMFGGGSSQPPSYNYPTVDPSQTSPIGDPTGPVSYP